MFKKTFFIATALFSVAPSVFAAVCEKIPAAAKEQCYSAYEDWDAHNYANAFAKFTKLNEQGHHEGFFPLGYMYYFGNGVEKNLTSAFKWLSKAAEQNNAYGQNIAAFYIGYMYEYGNGISENHNEALKWYGKAAEAGFTKAEYNLGVMYDKGKGVV